MASDHIPGVYFVDIESLEITMSVSILCNVWTPKDHWCGWGFQRGLGGGSHFGWRGAVGYRPYLVIGLYETDDIFVFITIYMMKLEVLRGVDFWLDRVGGACYPPLRGRRSTTQNIKTSPNPLKLGLCIISCVHVTNTQFSAAF